MFAAHSVPTANRRHRRLGRGEWRTQVAGAESAAAPTPERHHDPSRRPEQPRVSIVVGTLGAAQRLLDRRELPGDVCEVVVVGTASAGLLAEADAGGEVWVVTGAGRGGGVPVRRGLAEAVGDIVVIPDPGTALDGATLGRVVEALCAGADLVTGSRFLPEVRRGAVSRHRRWDDLVLTALLNRTCRSRMTDLGGGCTGIWRDRLPLGALDGEAADLDARLLAAMLAAGAVVVEMPLAAGGPTGSPRAGRPALRRRMRVAGTAVRARIGARTPAALVRPSR